MSFKSDIPEKKMYNIPGVRIKNELIRVLDSYKDIICTVIEIRELNDTDRMRFTGAYIRQLDMVETTTSFHAKRDKIIEAYNTIKETYDSILNNSKPISNNRHNNRGNNRRNNSSFLGGSLNKSSIKNKSTPKKHIGPRGGIYIIKNERKTYI